MEIKESVEVLKKLEEARRNLFEASSGKNSKDLFCSGSKKKKS